MIIGVPIPNNFFAPWEAVKSLLAVAPKYRITYSQGPYIYDNRNRLIAFAKKQGDSLLMIDSDIVFTENDVIQMERHIGAYPAATGVYALGVSPYPAAILKRTNNDYEFCPPPSGFSPVAACGGGFMGLSWKLIQQLPENPCNNVFEGKSMHGEDISLCHRINEAGLKIYCDPKIKVGQVRSKIIYHETA